MTPAIIEPVGDFAGKVVVITGAASGIGRATAMGFARRGGSVVIADLSLAAAQQTADEIGAAGGHAVAFEMDVAVADNSKRVVEFALDTFGSLTHAVNNAGLSSAGRSIGDLDLDRDWKRVIDVGLNGVLYGLHYQLPAIVAAGGGAVVNISSVASTTATYHNVGYVTVKHALVGMTKAAALDYSNKGVRVNAVAPGYIDTPMMQQNSTAEQTAKLADMHPVGRMGQAGEVAGTVLFLLSDAAGFTTGVNYLVDGGFTAGYAGVAGRPE